MIVTAIRCPTSRPALDTKEASLTTHASETIDGVIGATAEIAPGDWAFAKCDADHPFPGTPDPTQICLKNGFDPNLLYQVVFTAKDPLVLGIGFAAFRDVGSFFKIRRAGRRRDAEPGRRRRIVGDHPRRLAIRQLRARLPPSRLQSGRGRPAGL